MDALWFVMMFGTIISVFLAAHLVIDHGWHPAEATFAWLVWPLTLLVLAAYGAYLLSKRVAALLDEHEEEP